MFLTSPLDRVQDEAVAELLLFLERDPQQLLTKNNLRFVRIDE